MKLFYLSRLRFHEEDYIRNLFETAPVPEVNSSIRILRWHFIKSFCQDV